MRCLLSPRGNGESLLLAKTSRIRPADYPDTFDECEPKNSSARCRHQHRLIVCLYYDRRGGLGIQPNGMRILRELDQELHDKVVAQGFPVERYTFKNAKGWTLAYVRGHDGRNQPERSVMTSREGIWKVLRDAVPDEAIVYRHVSGVSMHRVNQWLALLMALQMCRPTSSSGRTACGVR